MVICSLSSKTHCLSTETIKVSYPSTRGKWACWHAKTNIVIYSFCRRLNVFWPRLLQSPHRQPNASKPIDTQGPIWSSAPFCQRLNVFRSRLLLSPLSTRGKQARWHVETNMVICTLSSKTQCLSIETTKVSPSPSRGNQVRWHTKTNYGDLVLFKDPRVLWSRQL